MASGPPSYQQIYGPFLIGAFLSTLLYGVTAMQMFIYFRSSKSDPTWMRLFILYLFLAETANTGFNIALVYEPLITRYGEQYPLMFSPLFLRADAFVTVAISTPVQLFMAWRIAILTGTYLASCIIAVLALTSFGGGVWTTVSVSLMPQFRQFSDFRGAPTTWLVTSACADVAITICLVYSLSKKKTGFAQMDDYITGIMIATIQTGAITAIAALADAIVFLAVKDTTIFFIWDLSLSKLYSNSILSSLNARNHAWQRGNPLHRGGNALFGTSEIGSHSRSGTTVVNMRPQTMKFNQPPVELGMMSPPLSQHKMDTTAYFSSADHSLDARGDVKVTREIVIS